MENQETKLCKHCQTEIPKKAKVCPQCRKKQGGIGKIILIGILAFVLLGSCLGGSDDSAGTSVSDIPIEDRIYISDAEIENAYASPDSYEGKFIKIGGQVFGEPEIHDGEIYFQMHAEPDKSGKNTMVHFIGNENISSSDYVIVDGVIKGSYDYKNMMGATIAALEIETDNVVKSNYITCCAPTIKEVVLDQTIDQYGYSITVNKIEFAENETRVYLTATNNGTNNFSIYTYSMKAVQNQTQYEQQYNYNADYEEVQSELLSGTTTSGIVVFPAMDSEMPLKIYCDGYCDNWDIDIETYVFECQ